MLHYHFSKTEYSLSRISAFASVFLLTAAGFFGLGKPFQAPLTDADEIITSSVVNQVFYATIYLLAFLSLYSKRNRVLSMICTEKWFFIFLAWCLVTTVWSPFPQISLKRWIQFAGSYLVFMAGLIHFQSDRPIILVYRVVSACYIFLCLVSVFLVGEAVTEYGWRGLASTKNVLGQAAIVGTIVWLHALASSKRFNGRCVSLGIACMGIILLLGSKSATSIMVFVILVGGFFIAQIESKVFRPHVGMHISLGMFGMLILVLSVVVFTDREIMSSLLSLIGRDLTLTERSDLWAAIFEDTRKHLLFGIGYGGYWVVNSPAMQRIFAEFVWLPNQAHNGYLEILNEVGLIGLIFFVILVIRCLKNFIPEHGKNIWKSFFLIILILNFTESTIIQVNQLTSVTFMLSYLILKVGIENNHEGNLVSASVNKHL